MAHGWSTIIISMNKWIRSSDLPGKGDSNSHGARPVHLIIMIIKKIRTSRLSINELCLSARSSKRSPSRPTALTTLRLRCAKPSHTTYWWNGFSRVILPTNPSTCCLLFLVMKLSWRVCWGVDYRKNMLLIRRDPHQSRRQWRHCD